MKRISTRVVAAVLPLLAACGDLTGGIDEGLDIAALSAAFGTVPLGFNDVTSSYTGDGTAGPSLWLPGARSAPFGAMALMGGGIGDAFVGGVGFGRGFGHHGPFGGAFGGGFTCTGTFNASTGRFVCDPIERNGLTISRSAAYRNAAGQVQQAFDTVTTNAVNVETQVSGTVSYSRDSTSGRGPGQGRGPRHAGCLVGDTTTILTANSTVSHTSNRAVSGLAQGSTQRTVNGTSRGTENTTGTSSRGNFTSTRSAADTTSGLVIPIANGRPTYPTAGRVVRVMQATVTYAGESPVTSTRREVVTYDGSSTAQVTITKDGVTQTCTLPLPHGRLSCSS